MTGPLLTQPVHETLRAALRAGATAVECSLDLERTRTTVAVSAAGWVWQGRQYPYLETCKERTIYYWAGDAFEPVARFSTALIKLVPTEWGPPTFEIDGIKMLPTAHTTVIAPRDGGVTERAAEPGEMLPPGATLSVLTDVGRPWLNVWIDEPSLASVHLGDTAEVRVDGRERSFQGTVSCISPVAEFTPKNVQTPEERAKLVFRVKIALDNPEGVFKPGMPADAYFSGAPAGAAGG